MKKFLLIVLMAISGGSNILFVAGHVEHLSTAEVDVIRNSEGGDNSAYIYPGFDIR